MQYSNQYDRFFEFTECSNFRHMGGYPTANGRTTRADRLFRSCIFELNNQSDVDRFEALDIETVFDFRMPNERELRPLKLDVQRPPAIVEIEISGGKLGSSLTQQDAGPPQPGDIKTRMTDWYGEMPTDALDTFQSLFQHLAQTEGGVLVICNTGKDRSGMAAGLILAALGVADEIILEDYLLSSWAYRDIELSVKRYLSSHPITVNTEFMGEVFTVYPEYLAAFKATASNMAGSFEAFLEAQLELDSTGLKELSSRFTA